MKSFDKSCFSNSLNTVANLFKSGFASLIATILSNFAISIIELTDKSIPVLEGTL